MAQTFSFPNVDFEIEQQIITAGTSTRIRNKTLPDPTYDRLESFDGRRAEQSSYQARDMESQGQRPNSVRKANTLSQTCRNCGGILYPYERQCPAQGKTCRNAASLNV